jgi:adenine-specific DNA-methyltransferase
LVRSLLDEVFGSENFISQISFKKTAGATSEFLAPTADYILMYAKLRGQLKYREVYLPKGLAEGGAGAYDSIELRDGSRRRLTQDERADPQRVEKLGRVFRYQILTSPRIREARTGYFSVQVNGADYLPTAGEWKTHRKGMGRLVASDRAATTGTSLSYIRYVDDFPAYPLGNIWDDTQSGSGMDKMYVVQTNQKVIERCMLMATDPGDLVLDPTCGSGTTAYVAEQWGRRWITTDTSRVALALARTRLMAAKYPYYILADSPEGIQKEAEVTGTPPRTSVSPQNDVRKGFVSDACRTLP